MEKNKEDLLEKYRQKEPKLFIQYDGLDLQSGGNSIVCPDKEGHCFLWGLTYELMDGANVRILIQPGTPKETVLALLEKMRNNLKNQDDWQAKAKDELRQNRLRILQEFTLKCGYTLEDVNNLLNTMKVVQDKKTQKEEAEIDCVTIKFED